MDENIPSTIQIPIREIQHFLYCPHRWGLLTIDCAWAENYYVVKGNLLHERVHNPDKSYKAKGCEVLTSVSVYCDDPLYEIYGYVDCLELRPSPKGVTLPGRSDKVLISIVEYKPTMPKTGSFREDDALQVFAQKICIDRLFQTNSEGILYYSDCKKRVSLPFEEEYTQYDRKLKDTLQEMRGYMGRSEIPAMPKGQKCSGCSMKDICMPTKRIKKPFARRIAEQLEEA